MKSRLLAVALAGMLAGGPATAAEEASVVRGGRLYDDWSRELQVRPPREPHPAFAAKGSGVPAADTWRCAECHGRDYAGNHGMVGIRNRRGGDPAAIVALLKDGTHRYGGLMRERDLLDIANFVSRGQVDMRAIIAAARPSGKGLALHADYFGTICSSCHGLDGKKVREMPPVGDVARQIPHQALHTILNGHPRSNMPSLRVLGEEFAGDMLAYLQTLPTLNLPASIAHGGRLYDNWQVELKLPPPSVPHPSYPPAAAYAQDAPRTWRCKECHGWDYLGDQGDYARGAHATGVKGIRGMVGADPARIVAVMRDTTHRYGAVLRQADLHDLANFVSKGQVDMDATIDRKSRRALGDAGRGGPHFRTICAACHGIDGRRIVTTTPIGRVAKENPWESLHKILNGHPDEAMPALRMLNMQALIDILAHAQGLPEDR
jgi:mono/diheme cytochrome c family protein